MPFLSRVFKGKETSSHPGPGAQLARDGPRPAPKKLKWEDAWTRKEVAADEVDQLLHICTQEMKSRALDMPFLLLPFRPNSDPSAARTFIRAFFKNSTGFGAQHDTHSSTYHELKLVEPMVLCSIMKWCWSRLSGGVVTWTTYELFQSGEKESKMAKDAFDTLIPLSVESVARKNIVFDFFDLLAAIAASGKNNGLGGLKLSRLAGWWAFDFADVSGSFDQGYKTWASAADASSHLFFAYLRSLAPDDAAEKKVAWRLPRSLQTLVAQTDYPPIVPASLQNDTSKVLMTVDSVSPTPLALLRRAKHFEYRPSDRALQVFSNYDDPIKALTPECQRVLDCISSTNQSSNTEQESGLATQNDSSWSRFEDIGFGSVLDSSNVNGDLSTPSRTSANYRSTRTNQSNDLARPTTPSWADFMTSGFDDKGVSAKPAPLLLPPDKILPPISPSRVHSSQSNVRNGFGEENLEPGELASVNHLDLDETFWWVWMTSLGNEEPPARKAFFGRCAFVETEIVGGRWLLMEEQVKGAAVEPELGAYVAEKKSRFTISKRSRRSSMGRKPTPAQPSPYQQPSLPIQSKTHIEPGQQAKVHAAAAALVQKKKDEEAQAQGTPRRGRNDEQAESKTNSVFTLQPVIMSEAAPAMQWARKFDKETIRQQYLGDSFAGKGSDLGQFNPSRSTLDVNQADDKPIQTEKDAGNVRAAAAATVTSANPGVSAPFASRTPLAASGEAALVRDRETANRAPSQATQQNEPTLPPASTAPLAASDEAAMVRERETRTGIPSRPDARAEAIPLANKDVVEKSAQRTNGHAPEIAGAAMATAVIAAPVAALTTAEDVPPPPAEKDETPIKPTAGKRVSRKPVGSIDSVTKREHPAFRTSTDKQAAVVQPTAETQPPSQAGALAFRNPSMEQQTSPKRTNKLQKKGSTRGFRGIFGKRKEDRSTTARQDAMNGTSLAPPDSKPRNDTQTSPSAEPPTVRRVTGMKETEQNALPVAPVSQELDAGEPGPEIATSEFIERHAGVPAAVKVPEDHGDSFSDFSSGPREEATVMPEEQAHVSGPEEHPLVSNDSNTSATPQRNFHTRAAALLAAQTAQNRGGEATGRASHESSAQSSELQTPTPLAPGAFPESEAPSIAEVDRDPVHREEEDENDATPVPEPGHASHKSIDSNESGMASRWAAIRRNAENAAVGGTQRSSEEPTSRQSQSQSVRTNMTSATEDGETSGEETIESRVARIKARVAELTQSSAGTPAGAALRSR